MSKSVAYCICNHSKEIINPPWWMFISSLIFFLPYSVNTKSLHSRLIFAVLFLKQLYSIEEASPGPFLLRGRFSKSDWTRFQVPRYGSLRWGNKEENFLYGPSQGTGLRWLAFSVLPKSMAHGWSFDLWSSSLTLWLIKNLFGYGLWDKSIIFFMNAILI